MSENGTTLFAESEYFKVFPDPKTVFASSIDKHLRHFLPLATVELSKVNPEWSGKVHFIVPIGPKDSAVGETTTEFHTYYSCFNWVGFQYQHDRCSYIGDWRMLVTDSDPEFYHAAVDGYETAKNHFKENKALHYVSETPDKNGDFFDSNRPRQLVEQLGGECYDANWANMGNFNITRFGSWFEMYNGELEEEQKIRPLTQDGRPFEYIGFINADYYNMNKKTDYTWTESLLFYDPVSKISLVTFDWT
jgi:hypothetical protein